MTLSGLHSVTGEVRAWTWGRDWAEGHEELFLACVLNHTSCFLTQLRTLVQGWCCPQVVWAHLCQSSKNCPIDDYKQFSGGIFSIEVPLPQITLASVKVENKQQQNPQNRKLSSTKPKVINKHPFLFSILRLINVVLPVFGGWGGVGDKLSG